MGAPERGRAQAIAMCKCDWEKCSKRCECRCHIGIEANRAHSYEVGQSLGLEIAAGKVMEMAIDSFRRGEDQEAEMLRKLSESLKKDGTAKHPGPDVKYDEE